MGVTVCDLLKTMDLITDLIIGVLALFLISGFLHIMDSLMSPDSTITQKEAYRIDIQKLLKREQKGEPNVI